VLFFTAANTCLCNLLHTTINASFQNLPLSLNRWYKALHTVFVLIALIAHMYKTSLTGLPPLRGILELPLIFNVVLSFHLRSYIKRPPRRNEIKLSGWIFFVLKFKKDIGKRHIYLNVKIPIVLTTIQKV
jgi:hypothetical protein